MIVLSIKIELKRNPCCVNSMFSIGLTQDLRAASGRLFTRLSGKALLGKYCIAIKSLCSVLRCVL